MEGTFLVVLNFFRVLLEFSEGNVSLPSFLVLDGFTENLAEDGLASFKEPADKSKASAGERMKY